MTYPVLHPKPQFTDPDPNKHPSRLHQCGDGGKLLLQLSHDDDLRWCKIRPHPVRKDNDLRWCKMRPHPYVALVLKLGKLRPRLA